MHPSTGKQPRLAWRAPSSQPELLNNGTIMNREELPSILCVDDEPRIVDGLAVHLRRDYQVLAANGGKSAPQIPKEKGRPRRHRLGYAHAGYGRCDAAQARQATVPGDDTHSADGRAWARR